MCQSSDITSYFLYYEVLIRSKDAADVVDDASCGPWVPKQNLQLNRLIHGIFETFGVLIERLLDLRIFYLQIMGVLSVDLLTSFKFKNGKIYRTYCGFFFYVGFVVHDWKWFSPWSVENKLYQHWKLSGCHARWWIQLMLICLLLYITQIPDMAAMWLGWTESPPTSILSFVISSSRFLTCFRSFARRFWNQIFT